MTITALGNCFVVGVIRIHTRYLVKKTNTNLVLDYEQLSASKDMQETGGARTRLHIW